MTKGLRPRMPRAATLLAVVAAGVSAALPAGAGAERVRIVRDSRAEPHIQARSAAGAAYGFAYAQMEDQAAYILTNIATATGRSAELLGPECLPKCFASDQSVHLFRVPETAEEKFGTLPRDSRERFEAFAAGINDYVERHPDQVPSWAVHVSPQDVVAQVQYGFILSQAADAVGIPSGVESSDGGAARATSSFLRSQGETLDQGASNGFVLAGSRTASGKPIVEGDPHLGFDGASRWYAAQLSYPGTSVEGVVFRGGPVIAIGSNGEVAWTHTANHGNQNESERYREKLNPADSNSYLYGGSYQPMTVRNVPIEVQTSPGAVNTVNVRFRYTVHGPVISDPLASPDGSQAPPASDFASSVTVSQYEQVGLATQLWAENEADSLGEYRQALGQNQLSGFNILAADDTEVFFSPGGRNGILNPGLPLNGALDGTDPYQTWQGILPFEAVPQATNPPSGYYQNANNAPWYSAPGQIIRSQVPYYLAKGDTNGTRSRRQTQLLDPLSGVTLEQAGELAMDNYVEIATNLKLLLAEAAVGAGAKVVAGNALIQAWDNRAEMNSTAYPLFATWVRGLDDAVVSTTNPPATFTDAQRDEARRAMVRAYDGMLAQYGTIAVRYGDLHTFTWGSFAAPVNGGDSDLATLRLTNCKGQPGALSPDYYHPCAVRGGSSYMFHVDLANPDALRVTRPASASDDPASPHYTDNARDYVADAYRTFPVSRKALDAEKISSKRLRIPGTKPRKLGLRVRGKAVKVNRSGALVLKVRCRAQKGERCKGKVKLSEAERKAAKTIASQKFSLRRGTGAVRMKLRAPARRELQRGGTLRVLASITVKALDDRTRSRTRLKLVARDR